MIETVVLENRSKSLVLSVENLIQFHSNHEKAVQFYVATVLDSKDKDNSEVTSYTKNKKSEYKNQVSKNLFRKPGFFVAVYKIQFY